MNMRQHRILIVIVFAAILTISCSVLLQIPSPTKISNRDSIGIAPALRAIDDVLTVGLAASLAGLAVAACTFAAVAKSNFSSNADNTLNQNLEAIQSVPDVIPTRLANDSIVSSRFWRSS